MKKPNILVITVSAWNSKVGANSWATFLKNYDRANVANLCIRDEVPDSEICSRYFVVSENRIIKSLLNRNIKTGFEVSPQTEQSGDLEKHNLRYQKMGKNRRYSMLLARELIWKLGKWKTPELDAFLDEFKPDIILHSMEGYIHLNRIIAYAIKRTGAKAAGYIWDDNFTYKQSNKLGYKLYRFFQRGSLRRLAKLTDAFFAISDMAKEEADAFFGIDCHLLTKPLNTTPVVQYGDIGPRIQMLYTGNIYIGRDKSLLKIIRAAKSIPDSPFFVDIYTKTKLDESFLAEIDPKICCVHAPITQQEVLQKQKEADILLYVEDIDGPDANVARLSFSTKTTDYLSSGRCILAVGNPDTAPMRYLKRNQAALVAGDERGIEEILAQVIEHPDLLKQSAENAARIGIENHNKEKVQGVFDSVIRSLSEGY